MPVIQKTVGGADVTRHAELVAALAGELTAPKAFGQPLVMEEEFPRTGRLGVTVVWDRLDGVSDLDRPAIIRKAYEAVHPDKAKQIAFAIGYTPLEAADAGLLPTTVTLWLSRAAEPALREQCVDAMRQVAGTLFASPWNPMIRTSSVQEAEACVDELVRLVPTSRGNWVISDDRLNQLEAKPDVNRGND